MMATGAVQTLDPINAKGSGAGYPQYNESLLSFPDGQYPPEPKLIEGYDVSEDGLTYTFDLKTDVTFHDGSELTAADVVYSYRRLAGSDNSRNRDDIIGDTMTVEHEKDTPEGEEAELADYVSESLGVEAVDESTVEMRLESPFQYTLFQIAGGAFAILPEGAVGDIEGYDGEYGYNEFFSTADGGPEYAGTGPFEVDAWNKGSSLELAAYDGYHGAAPSIDGITYTIVSDANTRLDRFENGNADILEGMPTSAFTPDSVSIENRNGNRETGTYDMGNQTVNYGQIPTLETEYIVFNTLEVPHPVRQAFAYVMNQHDIAEDIYKGLAKPAYHITPPAPYPTFDEGASGEESYDSHAENGANSQTDFGSDGYPYGYGETRIGDAQAVMEEAGYGEDNTYSVTATTIAGDEGYRQVFLSLQEKARAAHIDMEIVEADFGTIISRAISGDMEMFGLGDGMEYPGPQNFLRFLWGNNPGNQFTRWGAENSHYNEEYRQTAIDTWESNYEPNQGDSRDDQLARNRAFQAVEEMNWASVQELPFIHPTKQRFWHDGVDVEMYGVMETQTFDDVTLDR